MNSIENIFKHKKVNFSKLVSFGFEEHENVYIYKKTLPESNFILKVAVTGAGEISAEITDPEFEEPYTLHLASGAAGGFVSLVREQYESALSEIAEKCFDRSPFKGRQTEEVIEYVRKKYSDEPEFLWQKFSDNAVFRRSDNKKWYGALLTVSKRKLGINSDEAAEIIDLRTPPEKMEFLIDNRLYFPGRHMNKKNWYTVILDGSVPPEELFQRIDESYLPANKKQM